MVIYKNSKIKIQIYDCLMLHFLKFTVALKKAGGLIVIFFTNKIQIIIYLFGACVFSDGFCSFTDSVLS